MVTQETYPEPTVEQPSYEELFEMYVMASLRQQMLAWLNPMGYALMDIPVGP